MAQSSIDVIEEVLGASLFSSGWRARSIAEIDTSDVAYQVPAISVQQYHAIQTRLRAHWSDTGLAMRADRTTLYQLA
jgi:hypothetical protein